jgi:hypothetical protein
MDKHLGKYDENALAFAREALEAADIEYSVRDDSAGSRYSIPLGRMEQAPATYDVFVEEARLAEARAAIERWQAEAQDVARRESGAAPPTPEELAADAEWEKQNEEAKKRPPPSNAQIASRLWLPSAVIAIVVTILAWLLAGH